MTPKKILTIAAPAVAFVGIIVTAALFRGSDKNSSAGSALSRSSLSSEVGARGLDDDDLSATGVRKNSRLRSGVSPATAALNEKFGESQVKLASRTTADISETLKTALKITDYHLEVFNPENKKADQMAFTLFGEFAGELHLSSEQSMSIKKNYSILLGERRSKLANAVDNIINNPAGLIETLLYANAKHSGKLTETEYAQKEQVISSALLPFSSFRVCGDQYEPTVLKSWWMKATLNPVLNPEQTKTYLEGINSGRFKSINLSQPPYIFFLDRPFFDNSPLEEISKKVGLTRQEMEATMQILRMSGN